MKTVIEVARDGVTPLRVFHAAGKVANNTEGRYQWTHKPDKRTRDACTACSRGTIPANVKDGTYKADS